MQNGTWYAAAMLAVDMIYLTVVCSTVKWLASTTHVSFDYHDDKNELNFFYDKSFNQAGVDRAGSLTCGGISSGVGVH